MAISPVQAAAAEKDMFEHVHALAFDADARVLWLGAHSGLFRSEAGSRSWQRMTLPGAHPHVDVMAPACNSEKTEACWAQNRRAHFLVKPE
jgi:hypothetical protein